MQPCSLVADKVYPRRATGLESPCHALSQAFPAFPADQDQSRPSVSISWQRQIQADPAGKPRESEAKLSVASAASEAASGGAGFILPSTFIFGPLPGPAPTARAEPGGEWRGVARQADPSTGPTPPQAQPLHQQPRRVQHARRSTLQRMGQAAHEPDERQGK
jgi:hypothetical protein